MIQITMNEIEHTALETIESEMPDMDYGCEYEKDAALAFMYKAEGIIAFVKALGEKYKVNKDEDR